jgi:hypothetical protein
MNCPSEIAGVLLQILETGLLRTRARAWAQDTERCALEADHIHNLPTLLADYSPDLLRFYWETERRAFMEQSSAADRTGFEPLWNKLAPHIERLSGQVVTQ